MSSPFYSKSEEMFVGGMSKGTSYSHFYTGYSGAINTFLLFNDYVTETSRNIIADSFFVSGHKPAGFVTGESINKEVTGVKVVNVLSGTGITGYQLTGTGSYQDEGGNQIPLYGLSGVTGKIFQDVLVDSTGPKRRNLYNWFLFLGKALRKIHHTLRSQELFPVRLSSRHLWLLGKYMRYIATTLLQS